MAPPFVEVQERIRRHTILDATTGCIVWTGGLNGEGYAQLQIGATGPRHSVHRIVWMLSGREIPDGMCVMHQCDNPSCCNINHLRIGTRAENQRDMANKGRGTKSKKGLPYGVRQSGRKYSANVKVLGKWHYLGAFETAEEAGKVAVEFRNANA